MKLLIIVKSFIIILSLSAAENPNEDFNFVDSDTIKSFEDNIDLGQEDFDYRDTTNFYDDKTYLKKSDVYSDLTRATDQILNNVDNESFKKNSLQEDEKVWAKRYHEKQNRRRTLRMWKNREEMRGKRDELIKDKRFDLFFTRSKESYMAHP